MDGSFYGPALVEAHHLESEVAGYPRVVVSPTIRPFPAAGQTYSSDRQADQFMKQMATMCRSLIYEDAADGSLMIDFLGEPGRREGTGRCQESASRLAGLCPVQETGCRLALGPQREHLGR